MERNVVGGGILETCPEVLGNLFLIEMSYT